MKFRIPFLPEMKSEHDPALDLFDKACWVLTHDGRHVGHVSSTLGWYVTPLRPRTKQDWIWLLVVWADGTREFPIEEYEPWDRGYLPELTNGEFDWNGTVHTATRVPDDQLERVWAELGISEADF